MTHRTLTDAEILAKCDSGARPRVRMSLRIVNQLIRSAEAAGYTLKVHEYEEDGEVDYDVKSAIFNLDECFVTVHKDAAAERIGWVFILCNSGWDCISDYTTNLEEFLGACLELGDRMERGLECCEPAASPGDVVAAERALDDVENALADARNELETVIAGLRAGSMHPAHAANKLAKVAQILPKGDAR